MEYAFKPYVLGFFVEPILAALSATTGMSCSAVASALSAPPTADRGDLALPCFELARMRRQSPIHIAADLAVALAELPLGPDWPICRVAAEGPYVNLHFDRSACSARLLAVMAARGRQWAASSSCGTVCIDFCSPNIAKPLHLGHLRSTVIGNALARLHEYAGYRAVRINYLGDWGTSLGKLMVAWRRWGDAEAVAVDPARELLRVYVRFAEEAETLPQLLDEAREAGRLLEAGDASTTDLWQWVRVLCMSSVRRSLDRLGVHFDVWDAESLREPQLHRVVDLLSGAGLLVESQGAMVVELDGAAPCLILRTDGATLYATRDLATALHRQSEYAPQKSLYVVDNGQAVHFAQVFGVLARLNLSWSSGLRHVGFGVMKLGGKRLRTREGDLIYLDEVLDDAVACARAELVARSPEMQGLEQAAASIGIGAVIFNDLKHSREQDVDFVPSEALRFDGETGPYVQYAHARCCSILRRAGLPDGVEEADVAAAISTELSATFAGDEEWGLAKELATFYDAVRLATQTLYPHLVARSLLGIAKSLNRFYKDCPVLRADAATAKARLSLVAATALTLRQGLWLMGMDAPRMREG